MNKTGNKFIYGSTSLRLLTTLTNRRTILSERQQKQGASRRISMDVSLWRVSSFLCLVIAGGFIMSKSVQAQGEAKKYKVTNVKYLYGEGFQPDMGASVYDVALDANGNIYLPSFRKDQVLILDKDMNQIKSLDGIASPHGIHVDKDGNIYVATYKGGKLIKFNKNFERVAEWDAEIEKSGLIKQVGSVTTDNAGNVYVGDYQTQSLYKFAPDGKHLSTFNINKGDLAPEPHGITTDGEKYLYLAERGKKVVQVYTLDGQYQKDWVLPDGFDPLSVRFIGKNFVVVPNYKTGVLHVFDLEGNQVATIGEYGAGEGQFAFAMNIAFDGQGTIFVTEQNGNRLHKVDISELLKDWNSKK